jgi:hypothetical protein
VQRSNALLIHPGFHKTGTTFLQRKVFTDAAVFRYAWGHEEVDRHVNRPHELDFDPAPARAAFAGLGPAPNPDLIDVVSSETLCGVPFFGSRESAARAIRLHRIFGEAKILITVRRQKSIIRSVYLQYLIQGGTLPPERFFAQNPPIDYFGFDHRVFEFHKLAEYYASLFGGENVLVLAQEGLRKDPDRFVRAVCDFCGAPAPSPAQSFKDRGGENVSPNPAGIPLLRLANRLRGGPVNPEMRGWLAPVGGLLRKAAYRQPWSFLDHSRRLDAAIEQRFGGRFALSNGRLQALAGDDLAAFGYEMPAPEQP